MSMLGGMGGGMLVEAEAQARLKERGQRLKAGVWGIRHDNRVLRGLWAPLTVLVVLLGVGTGEIIVSLVAATVLIAGWTAWTWTRYALHRLDARVEVSHTHAFVGETINLSLTLENRKVLPLTGLQVRINLPEILEPSNEPFSRLHESAPQEGVVVRSTSMRWYERLIWRFQIPLLTRGHFQVARIDLISGDLFNVYRRERTDDAEHTLWIYPEVVSLDRLSLPRLRPQGDQRGGQRLFEDPTRLQTIRDYRPGDALKKVDWKATARRQALQSRVYDPSSDLIAVVALNVSTLPHAWQGFYGDIFERAVSVAASLASDFANERVPVGLLANCTWPGHDTAIRVPPSRAPGQMTRILEALAMADVFTLVRIERMLAEERLTYGSTLALVTAVLTPELESSLLRLKRHGAQVALIYVGIDDPPATFAESPVYDIRAALEGLHFERVSEAGPWARSDRLDSHAPPPEPADDVSLPTFVGSSTDDPDPDVDAEHALSSSGVERVATAAAPPPASAARRPPEPSSARRPPEPTTARRPPEPSSARRPPEPTTARRPPEPSSARRPPEPTSPWARPRDER